MIKKITKYYLAVGAKSFLAEYEEENKITKEHIVGWLQTNYNMALRYLPSIRIKAGITGVFSMIPLYLISIYYTGDSYEIGGFPAILLFFSSLLIADYIMKKSEEMQCKYLIEQIQQAKKL